MRYDFHSHTSYSDGTLSPSQLLDRAESLNVEILAISDHDSVDGLKLARKHLADNSLGVKLVDAIEFSALSDFGEIHIVGLNIDPENVHLLQRTQEQQQKRWQRARLYEEKLNKLSITGVYSELERQGVKVVTRSHLSRALINLGYAKDNNQVFKKYLGKKGRVKVPVDWFTMEEAIQTIKSAGGISVLAHPTRYPMSNRRLGYLIEEFEIAGGEAMEMSYPSLSMDKRNWLNIHREKNNLMASGGSDFHYPDLKWSDLGRFAPIDHSTPHVLDRILAELRC